MNICTPLNQCGPLVGRILLVLVFILSGYGKIAGWEGTLGFMASNGIPLTSLLLALTIAVELGGIAYSRAVVARASSSPG